MRTIRNELRHVWRNLPAYFVLWVATCAIWALFAGPELVRMNAKRADIGRRDAVVVMR